MATRRPGKVKKSGRGRAVPKKPQILFSPREKRDAQGNVIERGKVVTLLSKPLPPEPEYKDVPVHGRKVILIPSARPEGLFYCVKSFIENAHHHNYKGPIDFVIADYSRHEDAHKNRIDFEALEKEAHKAGLKNIRIHHMGIRKQRRVLNGIYRSDPERWGKLPSYVGNLNSTPDGYGPARNRVTVLAYQKGLLDNPKNVAILFDDDLVAKNLVRTTAHFAGKDAKLFGKTAEGHLVLKDTGSYFHNIDRHFNENARTLVAGGGVTFDGDVAAQDSIGTTLTSIESFLRGTRDVKKPRLKRMKDIEVDVRIRDLDGNLMSTERVPLARAVFSRRFLGPLSVHSGFLNLVRKSRESVGLGRSAFSPHYLSGGINPLSGERIPSTLQPTLGAGNMYARPHVLLSYPFIQSSERGEDRVFYEALGQDLPGGSVTGFTNPVAHIKGGMHARRSTALSNIVMEPGETNKVPQWKPKIESIKELLRARNAWWSRPQYAHEKQLLKKMVLNIEGQMGPIMRRDAERHQLPTETQAQRPAILPETPEGKQPTVFDMIRQGMFDRINQQMSRGPPQPQRVSPLLPAYRNIISDWRRMFPEESARIMPLIKLRQREHAEAQDRLHRVQAREIPNAESRELKDGD